MTDIPLPENEPPAGRATRLQRLQPMLTVVIALAAILLALWEGIENRKHNRLSVQPRLGGEVETGRDVDADYLRIAIESTGLGPAVIKDFRIYLDGRLQDATITPSNTPWAKVIEAVSTEGMRINAHAFGGGYYFPAGRRDVLFEARLGRAAPEKRPVSEILNRVAVQICYCSIYATDCDQVLLATSKVKALPCSD